MDTQYAGYAEKSACGTMAASKYVETHAHVMIQKVTNGWVITGYQNETFVATSVDQAILLMQGLCQRAVDRLP